MTSTAPGTAAARSARSARLGMLTATAAVLVGAGVAFAPAASATTGPLSGDATPELNNPAAWCDNGYKIESQGEQMTFTLDQDAAILVLKAATTNYWWTDAEAGVYTVPGKNAISHVIVCPADEPSDEPSEPVVETTPPVDEPTEPADEPTEPAEVPSTESTTPVTEVSSSSTPLAETQPELAHTGGGAVQTGLLGAAGLGLLLAGAAAMRAGRGGSHS